ncbi:phosphatase PAP2 family protein [Lactiplantibacillus sp. WILCCON 0030]|uniref:Phosphatase PAP2 family protein n=1 Tax=Lactiplantibacillus brownii TaxID=3069269 RepID=A0ABU1A7B1_9LACO|nr:phosphatase PAP2 family protein [Lactiplantibacillus brownii]MDQ7936821.1 phosphatase PAP2 family protein [Lactiplantibacillus brownii]
MIDKSRSRPVKFVIAVILFAYLSYFIQTGAVGIDLFDAGLASLATIKVNGFFTLVFKTISWLASPGRDVFWMVLLAFLLYGFKYKIQALWAVVLMAGGMVLETFFKHLIARARPIGHLATDDGYSFPSGHTLGTFLLVATIIIIIVPEIDNYRIAQTVKWISIVWLLLVMVARVYMQAHYPTDTIGAVLLGWLWLEIMEWVYVIYAPHLLKWRLCYRSYL